MKAVALFAAAMLVIVGLGIAVFSRVYPTADGLRAVLTSGLVAVVVQLFGFGVLRLANAAKRAHAFAAFGLGAVLRLAVLAAYALVVVNAMGLAPAPALLSLATFFFLSTLVEPLLLNV